MFFISRKKFTEEVDKRVCEEMKRVEEYRWRDEQERERRREMRDMEIRLTRAEKALGIDHPSHHSLEAVSPNY